MEEMEEVWKQVFLLESKGQHDEAAAHQEAAMSRVKERYDSRKLALQEFIEPDFPSDPQ